MYPLRPFQKAALNALGDLHQKSHVLCIAPTGSGKSLIYERAAFESGRRTVLISPLVALARQQFQHLDQQSLSVTLGAGGRSDRPPHKTPGVWIISPETLLFPWKQATLKNWEPNLLVVDECHCLWEWGEHFRTAFSNIPKLLKDYEIEQSLWLTATLPFEARLQLRNQIPQPLIELGSFDLPVHLNLAVHAIPWKNRVTRLMNYIQKQKNPGIIFVPTRESAQRITRLLQVSEKKTLMYHGGLSLEERKNAEQQVAQKIPDIIVATSAFGMGMNYTHLQYVILWQAPTSLLSLVQMIGRVGRHPHQTAEAIIFWDHDDFQLLEWTVHHSKRKRKELIDVLHFLQGQEECRRVSLTRYFDHTQRQPCKNLCDICLKTNGSPSQYDLV